MKCCPSSNMRLENGWSSGFNGCTHGALLTRCDKGLYSSRESTRYSFSNKCLGWKWWHWPSFTHPIYKSHNNKFLIFFSHLIIAYESRILHYSFPLNKTRPSPSPATLLIQIASSSTFLSSSALAHLSPPSRTAAPKHHTSTARNNSTVF